MSWTTMLRPFVPPIALSAYRRFRGRRGIRFTGDYPTWDAALADSNGYDDAAILARVRESALKVCDGRAAFERDGVAFDRPAHNFPLLASLLRIATECGNRLRVLDFGGSLGSTYFQCRPFLAGVRDLTWSVVEQPHFAECGRREFEDGRLRFFESIDTLPEPADAVLLSGVLPYVREPHELLRRVSECGALSLIIDRTGVIPGDRDRLTVQHIPASIYGTPASYPAWMLSRSCLKAALESSWDPVFDTEGSDGRFSVDGVEAEFRFWFLRKRGVAT